MSEEQTLEKKKKSKDITARILAGIGSGFAIFSLMELGLRGSRYGYEEALLYLIPAIILSSIAIAISRAPRVIFICIGTLVIIGLHAFG